MAKAKVTYAEQMTSIVLLGDPEARPEPPITAILFPFGYVEVSRAEDIKGGDFWVHFTLYTQDKDSQSGSNSGGPEFKGAFKDARVDGSEDCSGVDWMQMIPKGCDHIAVLVGRDSTKGAQNE